MLEGYTRKPYRRIGGLVTCVPPTQVPLGSAVMAEDVRYTAVSVKTREGLTQVLALPEVETEDDDEDEDVGGDSLTGNLPVELLDLGLGADGDERSFLRSLFRFDRTDYQDGTAFTLDVVFYNLNGSDFMVEIIDALDTVVASFTLPATTGTVLSPQRTASIVMWNPPSDNGMYRFHMPPGDNIGLLSVRIVAALEGANRTLIDIPLTSQNGSNAVDAGSTALPLCETTFHTYDGTGGRLSVWTYHAEEWDTISSIRFSAVMSHSGLFQGNGSGVACALFDLDTDTMVAGSEITVEVPDALAFVADYRDIEFDVSALIDGHTYGVRLKALPATFWLFPDYAVSLFKARLQLLLSPWHDSLVYWRAAKDDGVGVEARVEGFDYPHASAIFVEAVGLGEGATAYLQEAGMSDTAGGVDIPESLVTYGATKLPYRSGDIQDQLTPGNRYMVNPNGGTTIQAFLVYELGL